MTTAANGLPVTAGDSQAIGELIAHLGLSELSVAKIKSAQRVLSIGFYEAAVRLGFCTEEDLDAFRRKHLSLIHNTRRKTAIPSRLLKLVQDPYSEHSEALRALRTELLLRRESAEVADFITVLSPGSGEGRSCLAAELAILFAQLGKPTLLVDANLRSPAVHHLFGIDNRQGLSDALCSEMAPSLHAVEGLPHLNLLTAGSAHPSPLELLSDGRFDRMVSEWQRSFVFVVVDTPPINKYSDGLAVARITGRVLIVNRAQHTRLDHTRALLRRLSATQSQIVGAVITRF